MDYEFIFDEKNSPVAQFSLGHEAIGRWFTEELGGDQLAIAKLLDSVRQGEQEPLNSINLVGSEFQIRIDQNEVEVAGLASEIDELIDEPIPEDTNVFDAEFYAECGLEDFKQALLSWQSFNG